MYTTLRGKGWRGTVTAAVGLALAAVLGGGTRYASAQTQEAVAPHAVVTTTTTVSYSCFVTFQGGSTTVPYSLTYTGTAPDAVAPHHPFTAVLTAPVITPNPSINLSVQDVRLVYRLPEGARLVRLRQSGGSGLGPHGATVQAEGDTVVVTAAGPFQGGQPFQLPSVTLYLLAGSSGSEVVTQGGRTLADPAFSWVRSDPNGGTLRPFACFVPAPVPLTTTTLTSTG